MSRQGAWILEDQCSLEGSALKAMPQGAPILLVEDIPWLSAYPHHWQKLVMLISAQRHFAQALRSKGYEVVYRKLCANPGAAIQKFAADYQLDDLLVMEPTDEPRKKWINQLSLPCSMTTPTNNMFLTSKEEFAEFSDDKKQLVMENFYRRMRRKLHILMDAHGKPVGGKWNYDTENRVGQIAPLLPLPSEYRPELDDITREAFFDVKKAFGATCFGTMPTKPDGEFIWPVTREQAEEQLDSFIKSRLHDFGTYEDAMTIRSWSVFHSQLSPAMNCGLLRPHRIVERIREIAADTKRRDAIPLNSLEGFTRQIIGWREFMRGIYQRETERTDVAPYTHRNELGATQPLPEFYWTGKTDMVCMRESLKSVMQFGYSHHIPRLMVLANFALLHGIEPSAVNQWFTYAYADGYEWVTTPNVIGMALYADGGIVATKPYCAGGAYINRMSDYCSQCRYDPAVAEGPKACPFTRAYWPFMERHASRFQRNPRMSVVLRGLSRLSASSIRRRANESAHWVKSLPIYSPANGGAHQP
ncbi:MAG: cryptochrome/photolyase family protein [Phycisphaerae bacterium]